ncbi:helix-turn-helix domain-containing protein [Streptomyces sp. NPDC093984]|uniref:helix-turn-helix domain-containing protein n=1 Tax=Streptomyces sp. NPDC093984 TaxID=3366052 RepID=UPI0037FB9AAB
MDLTALRLRDTDQTMESIASAVGYTSARACSRAFRRHRGLAPGAIRSRSRRSIPARGVPARPPSL